MLIRPLPATLLRGGQRLLGADHFLSHRHRRARAEDRARGAGRGKRLRNSTRMKISAEFRQLWKRMGISNDDFIRTTEDRHKKRVQELFRKIRDNGYIYKGTYTGQYCHKSDELYVDGAQSGRSLPTCGRIHQRRIATRKTISFKLSAFPGQTARAVCQSGVHSSGGADANEVIFVCRSGLRDQSDQPLDIYLGHPGA